MKEINGFILSDDLTVITDYKGDNKDLVLPKGVKEIKDFSFMDKGITSIVLNEDLQRIGNRAFQGNDFIEIIIPKSVSEIGYCAFNCCYNLKKITILNPKVSVYVDSFDHCYEMEDIYFNGTQKEFEDAILNYDEDGFYLSANPTIHFSDGTIIKW